MTAFDAQAARERAEEALSVAVFGSAVRLHVLARDVLALDAQVTVLQEALARKDRKIGHALYWLEQVADPPYLVTEAIGELNWALRALAAVPSPDTGVEEGAER